MKSLSLLLILAASFLGALVLAAPATAAHFGAEMMKVEIPAAAKIKLTVLAAETGSLYAVVADSIAGPLRGEDAIVVKVAPPAADKIFAARILPNDRHWSVPVWPSSLRELPELTQYALWQAPDGNYGAMINVTGGGLITYLAGAPDGIEVSAHSYMDGFAPAKVPLFAIGFGDDPYRLTHELYAFALKVMREADPGGVLGRLREEKPYPEIFRYVGWCSWNAHYQQVNAAALIEHGESFRRAKFPLRWMIIDDGWEQLVANKAYETNGRSNSLAAFEADPKKFPGGLAPLIASLKKDYGISWVGVWHTFQGYWNGVDLNSPMGREYADALLPVNPAVGVPDPRSDKGLRFWEGYHGFMKTAGVDFVKTDDQSTMNEFVLNLVPISTAYANAQRNFGASAEKYFGSTVINCMSMNVDDIYQWQKTNVARVSRDFTPLGRHNPRLHTVDAVMNSMWITNLTYPDYDMWQTHDGHRLYHAVARAISGGPVYITDQAGRERFMYLWPLVLADGRVLRVDAPGLPTRKSLFTDPYLSRQPLMAFARTGEGGVLALWNVDRYERSERAAISPADVEGLQGKEFAIFERFSGILVKAGLRDSIPVRLGGWAVRAYTVMPVVAGFAPIGLVEKYFPSAAITRIERGENSVTVGLAEAGPFLAFAEKRPARITVNGQPLTGAAISFERSRLRLKLPKSPAPGPAVVLNFEW